MITLWALFGHTGIAGGLNNPCPGGENAEPVILTIPVDGPPWPRKRTPKKVRA